MQAIARRVTGTFCSRTEQNRAVSSVRRLPDEEVAAEVTRLCGDLRAARHAVGMTTREVAEHARIQQATVWRMETAKNQPTLLRYLLAVLAVGSLVDLDDGTARPIVSMFDWPSHPGYRQQEPIGDVTWTEDDWWRNRVVRVPRWRLGSELWWARQLDVPERLDVSAACRLLGMNHHTLTDVEFGPGWPSLASLVRTAGLTGRKVVLNAIDDGWRTPPWVPATWSPTPSATP